MKKTYPILLFYLDRALETTAEVPVWVNGLQRWVTGIDRKTTCDDVIKALLGSETCKRQQWNGHRPPEDLYHKYAIVERWRKVERPLDGRSKILKVWSAWGDAQRDVKLALRRRVHGESSCSGAIGKEFARRRRHHHHDLGMEMSAKTLHPRRFHPRKDDDERYHYDKDLATRGESPEREPCDYQGTEPKFTDTMEKLMKLILAQGETIQAQLKKLREREDQIDHFEHEVHRLRVKNHGSNYLLDTYLKGVDAEGGAAEEDEAEGDECEQGSKGEDSGIAMADGGEDSSPKTLFPSNSSTEQEAREVETSYKDLTNSDNQKENSAEALPARLPQEQASCSFTDSSVPSRDIQAHIELWEKILKVNKKLEKTEECLVKLHVKLRQHPGKRAPVVEVNLSPEEEERLERELEWTKAELEKVALHSNGVSKELEKNEEALANADEWLEVRHRVLDGLQMELDIAEKESEALMRRKEELAISNTPYNHQPPLTTICSQKLPHLDEGIGVVVTTTNSNPIKKIIDKDSHDTDSNSDTGLSSLHSSSEEGGYVLDTLV